MIEDVEILEFITNVLSIANVSIPVRVGPATKTSSYGDGKERMCTSLRQQFTF